MSFLQKVRGSGQRKNLRPVVLALACLAGASGAALAAGGTVTGKVEATPAKYLEETVVYLKGAVTARAPQTASMDQKGMKFIPHVLAVTKGDTVNFLNHDGVAHNVYSPDNEGYNLGSFKPEESRSYAFKSAGVYTQLCSIHPEMLAFIFVGDNSYSASVDREGRFTLKDVPPGTYTIAVWNSHLKAAAKTVTVTAGATSEVNFTVQR
jgi:plastocyanin